MDANPQKNQAAPESLGKQPPQNIDAEMSLLGGIMCEGDAYYEISSRLVPESFYNPRHQLIYEAIRRLDSRRLPLDAINIVEQLKLMGKLEDAGGAAYIAEINDYVASAATIESYAKYISDKYIARELINVCTKIQTMAYSEGIEINDLIQTAESDLFGVTQKNSQKEIQNISEVLQEALDRIQRAGNEEGGFTGLRSGFEALDKLTNGWQPGTLNIVAARPAMGKTAFVLSMAKNMVVDYDASVAFFSLEMSTLELVNRLIINVSEIDGEKIKRGNLNGQEWEQLWSKVDSLRNTKLFIDDTPSLSVFELCSKARKLKRDHNISCIIIDYLQLMTASGLNTYGNREQEVSTISRSLKSLAKELSIPVIALSQLNRGVEQRQGSDKRPQLSDLRESGAIEQDADIVIMLHRPEYYKITQDEDGNSLKGIAEVILAKHRSGSVDDIRLAFKSRFIKFDNLNPSEVFPSEPGDYVEMSSKINDDIYGKSADKRDLEPF